MGTNQGAVSIKIDSKVGPMLFHSQPASRTHPQREGLSSNDALLGERN